MTDLTRPLPFPEEEIDTENYTASLLGLCAAHHVMDERRMLEIRSGLDKAFVETAEQFTGRASSTIPKKSAEELYSSVLYQSDVLLLALKSSAKAVDVLKSIEIEEILKQGKSLILTLHEENRKIFQTAYKNRLHLPVWAYRYVMDKAFDQYWSGYSARFHARDCCANIDYPLLGRPAYGMKSQGVLFIHEYYTGILYENRFCGMLKEETILSFLKMYGKQYSLPYKDILFNIAELLFNNLMANALLDKPLFSLNLSSAGIRELESLFRNHNEPRLLKALLRAFSSYQGLEAPNCYSYFQNYLPTLSKDLFERIRGQNLQNFLVVSE